MKTYLEDQIDELQKETRYRRDENNMLILDNKDLKRKLIKN